MYITTKYILSPSLSSYRLIVPAYQLDLFLSFSFFKPASSRTLFVAPTTSVLVRAVPIDIAGVGGRSEICGIIAAHVIATAVSVRNKIFCLRSADGIAIVVSFFDSALSNDFSTSSSSFEVLLSSLVLSSSSLLFLLSILLVLSVLLLNDDDVLVIRPLKDADETELLLSRGDDDCSRKGPIVVTEIILEEEQRVRRGTFFCGYLFVALPTKRDVDDVVVAME